MRFLQINPSSQGQLAYEGSCYQFYHDYLTYDDAQAACSDKGGNLLSIGTEWVKSTCLR